MMLMAGDDKEAGFELGRSCGMHPMATEASLGHPFLQSATMSSSPGGALP
jgi:hypothetical protein